MNALECVQRAIDELTQLKTEIIGTNEWLTGELHTDDFSGTPDEQIIGCALMIAKATE